jgi:hypothetical protein
MKRINHRYTQINTGEEPQKIIYVPLSIYLAGKKLNDNKTGE